MESPRKIFWTQKIQRNKPPPENLLKMFLKYSVFGKNFNCNFLLLNEIIVMLL